MAVCPARRRVTDPVRAECAGRQPIGWPVTALIITVDRPPPTTAAASATVVDRQVVPTRRSSSATTKLLAKASPKRGMPSSIEPSARERGESQPPPLMSVTQPAGAWPSRVSNQKKTITAGSR